MRSKVVEVESWEAFGRLIDKYGSNRILYNINREAAGKQVAILSFILPSGKTRYIFTDNVAGDRLKETGIPLRKDERDNVSVRDEDVVSFVRSRTNRKDVRLISYWTQARGRERLGSAGVILLGHFPEASQEKEGVKGEALDDFESLMNEARALLEED